MLPFRQTLRLSVPARFALALVVCASGQGISSANEPWRVAPAPALVAALRNRVAINPGDANSWRLLGRALEQQGDVAAALDAFQRAAANDPESAAAHCDLARLAATVGNLPLAAEHWRRTIQLAPLTDYAQDAAVGLEKIAPRREGPEAKLAGFEVDWLDSVNPELGRLDQPLVPPSPLWVRMETGVLYNSNVALAPISRELSPIQPASFQAYVAPQLEYRYACSPEWQIGSAFRGYYNFNEPKYSQFNLEHQEPGLFVERQMACDGLDLLARLEYDFGYDLFNGRRLGTRHALNGSLNAQTCASRIWTFYATVDETDFRDDGTTPSITSLDGPSQTVGLSHTAIFGWQWLNQVRVGGDFQNAPLQGSTYAFRGTMFYADAELPLPLGFLLLLQGAHGYRQYPDFEFTPSRNENIWRAGVELRKLLSDCWSISGNFLYDRFASANDQFDSSRYTTGMFMTYQK